MMMKNKIEIGRDEFGEGITVVDVGGEYDTKVAY
jgi:hypothetical protein